MLVGHAGWGGSFDMEGYMRGTGTTARLLGAAALVGGLLWAPTTSTAGAPPALGAIIATGQTEIGVNNTGDLNFTDRGIAFDGADGIAPGCACEGWGAGDATTLVSGFAGQDFGISPNLTVDSFTSTADTAVSVTTISDTADAPVLRVTHDFHPSEAANVFEVTVTIDNLSAAPVEPRYRRAMDWVIPPTPFDEYVTIQGSEAAEAILFSSDDGFADGDPFAGPSQINFVGDAVDNLDTLLPSGDPGDSDHGALFDFGFDTIAPGGTFNFNIYYGAAATEVAATNALSLINAEVYSFGQPSSTDGATLGVPNTFIFAFAGVSGLVQFPSVAFASPIYSVNEGTPTAVIGVQLSGPAAQPVTVTYTSSAGTATPGADYTEVTGQLVIPIGASSGSFEIPVVNDGVAEGGETVTLVLSDPVNGLVGDPITAVLTINDPTAARPSPQAAARAVAGTPRFTG